jgi:hypothetical protein
LGNRAAFSYGDLKYSRFSDKINSDSETIGVLEREMGNVMKDRIAAYSVPDEYFVIQIDGRATSHHRRFLDALRAGLLLRDQFPDRDVKVCAAHARIDRHEVMH